MPSEVAIDTTILVAANQPLTASPRANSRFERRLNLLNRIRKGEVIALLSRQLVHEYRTQIPTPRNDYIDAFFQLLLQPGKTITNYAPWPGGHRDRARQCRFPREDDHVLRTALRSDPSTIVTEERRMISADACIHREFGVHIVDI